MISEMISWRTCSPRCLLDVYFRNDADPTLQIWTCTWVLSAPALNTSDKRMECHGNVCQ
ncbi:Uncharacterized protein DAT39_008131, partial [Clarias magur]